METVILNTKKDIDFAVRAAEILKRGDPVVIPTETVYGLAADALNEDAVRKIYEAKGRPSDNPLIVHIAEFSEIYPLVKEVPESARRLAEAFWPGPLTIILPKSDKIPSRTSGGLSTVAVRMPSDPDARAVIKASGLPLAAPSANISGFPSPTKAEHVIDDMRGRVPMIIDGGDCEVGVESTVITLATETPTVLRPGGITPEQISEVIGEVLIDDAVLNPLEKGASAASPGMKYKHYSPNAKISVFTGSEKGYIRCLEDMKKDGVFALCYEETEKNSPVPAVTMGKRAEPFSQTRRLFDALRELDEKGAAFALAECPERNGVGLAVCNRLFRAAAFTFIKYAPIVGLTGQTGAGKSTAAEIFTECGFSVVDCDAVARDITRAGSDILPKLAEAFGGDIIRPDGSLDRKELAAKAFSCEKNTEKLNSITHPAIIERTKKAAFELSRKNLPCVIDAPLLFQCGLDELCDITVCVTAPDELRVDRIMNRDKISESAARERMLAQPSESFYTKRADIVIENRPPYDIKELTRAAAERILSEYV